MYSRSSIGREDTSFRIPDGYRGNAFSPIPAPPVEPEEIDQPTAKENVLTEQKDSRVEESLPAVAIPRAEAKPPSPLAPLFPPKPTGVKSILGDIGLEELLILGVILLISQSETDDDVLLFLLLLLFYK